MQLPDAPRPIEVASHDGTIVVGVTEWGHPNGIQLHPEVFDLDGATLAARIMYLYQLARTIALAVRNVMNHRATGQWLSCWPTPTHVEILQSELSF